MGSKSDLATVFARLKAIIAPYAEKMDVAADNPTYYLLNIAMS
jgi:hypothetical protein